MSLFTKTYQDNLRALKKEQAKQDEPVEVTKTDPFESFVFNISAEIDPIDNTYVYIKNLAAVKHSYTFVYPSDLVIKYRDVNVFADAESILPTIITDDTQVVDSDFMTGYYLAEYHIFIKSVFTSFHCGITSDSLIRGIYYCILKTHQQTKWQMFGCDKNPTDKYKHLLVNGIRKPCDIYDRNTMSSVNIQLSEKVTNQSVDLYVCDIKSTNTFDVIKQLTFINDFISPKGTLILRLPTNFSACYTSMTTLLLYLSSIYNTVKIFKTPWGRIPKYYLILGNPKCSIRMTTMISYLNALKDRPNTPMISKTLFNLDDNTIYSDQIQKIKNIYAEMIKLDVPFNSEEATKIWANIAGDV